MAKNHSQGKKHDVKKVRAHIEALLKELRASEKPEEPPQDGIGAYGALIVNPKAEVFDLHNELSLILEQLEWMSIVQVDAAFREYGERAVSVYMNVMERLTQQAKEINTAIQEAGLVGGDDE